MNSTAVKLLQAAAEFVGGEKQSGVPLRDQMPVPLLLQAADIVLAHRRSPIPLAAIRLSIHGGDSSQ